MNKVVAVNLNDNSYQLEEGAYKALQIYLQQAEANLADDPDRDEVMKDLEQALADKCEQHLHKNKSVVTEPDMAEILRAMGPVESGDDEVPKAHSTAQSTPQRRLYLLPDEAMIGGVCAGLGAYFNVDVTVVRVLFVLLAFLTSGFWILAYLLMMVIVPSARTPEQVAAAHGEAFSAQELIGKAKQKYADMRVGENVRHGVEGAKPALTGLGHLLRLAVRIIAGFLAVAASVAIAALTVGLGVLVWAVLFDGYHLPEQLGTISVLSLLAGAAATYVVALLPLILLVLIFRRIAVGSSDGLSKRAGWVLVGAAVVWLAAIGTASGVGIANRDAIRGYIDAHPRSSEHFACPDKVLWSDPTVVCPCYGPITQTAPGQMVPDVRCE